jgi:hypothetical protein
VRKGLTTVVANLYAGDAIADVLLVDDDDVFCAGVFYYLASVALRLDLRLSSYGDEMRHSP